MFQQLINLLRGRKSTFKERPKAIFDQLEAIVKTSPENLHQLKEKGYIVLPFLTPEEVHFYQGQLAKYLDKFSTSVGELFYSSGRDDVAQRTLAKELTWPTIEPLLDRIIHTSHTHAEGCALLLKPTGEKSSLSPHQDSSLIDETQFVALYGWVALQDTTKENGGMFAIPSSHLWGNHYRSLDVPWVFENHTDSLLKHAQAINLKAGEIILFDTALIHGSYPNLSTNLRVALNLFFRSKETYMTHHLAFDDTPKNKIEEYKIDADFFLKEDFRMRPSKEKYPFLGYKEFQKPALNKKEIEKLISNYSKQI